MAQHCCGSKRKLLLSSFSRYQANTLSICALNADSLCTWKFLLGNLIKQRCDMHKYPANYFQKLDTHPSIHSFSSSRYVSSLRVRYVQSWYQRVAHCMRFCYGVPIGCNMYICAQQYERVELWHAQKSGQLSSASQLCLLRSHGTSEMPLTPISRLTWQLFLVLSAFIVV